jgi:hypothetical protein
MPWPNSNPSNIRKPIDRIYRFLGRIPGVLERCSSLHSGDHDRVRLGLVNLKKPTFKFIDV